jgi:hypothetical protein
MRQCPWVFFSGAKPSCRGGFEVPDVFIDAHAVDAQAMHDRHDRFAVPEKS